MRFDLELEHHFLLLILTETIELNVFSKAITKHNCLGYYAACKKMFCYLQYLINETYS